MSLNVQPAGLNPNTLYTFQAFPLSGSASATGVFFTGYWGGSSNALSLVNCTMTRAQIPPAPNLVNLVSGFATAVSQYLVVTQAAGVAFVGAVKPVATVDNSTTSSTGVVSYANLAVPTAGNSLAIPAILAGGANIVAGTLLFAAAVTSGGVATGTTDAFVATGSSLGTSSSGTYAVFVNQSGTAGATVPALTNILPLPQLPISTIGVYGQGRNWVALPDGVSFLGGDLVGGASGTKPYDYTDAVLYVSQNNFLAGGTTFKIPNSGEKIAAMQFVACLDASLGQGPLQVFTNETVFSVNTPPDATTWASLTNPILTESLIGSGGVGNDAVLQDNADLIFRTPDNGVQSMLLARLDFNRWGNSPISNEIYRIIQNDNPALLPFCSLVTFQNRRLMTAQPTQAARGVYHPALAVMNLDPLSSLQHKTPAIWEGQWTGLNVLKLITGTFASVKRCFAICLDATLTQIQVVEILADNPATQDLLPVGGVPTLQNVFSSIESPMIFERDQTNRFKRLANGEIYLDQITPAGVQVAAFWKVDESSAWTPWYTTTVEFQANDPGYRRPVGLGRPPGNVYDPVNNRPLREGYDFQVRFDFTGNCRFLGGRFAAELIDQPEFAPPKDSV